MRPRYTQESHAITEFHLPQFEKYCVQCKKYFLSDKMEKEWCPECNTILKIVVICKTCNRKYTVSKVESDKKCLTCNMPLKLKYHS